ncbi:hypothetical protein GCM10017691_58650 [Pseudonocardia petroleophila]
MPVPRAGRGGGPVGVATREVTISAPPTPATAAAPRTRDDGDRHPGPRRGGLRGDRERGALGDGVLGVGVDGDGAPELLGHQLRDQRDPGGPSDEQDRGELVGRQPRGTDGAAQRGHGLLHLRADHRLELAAVQADRAARPRQQHRDGDLGVAAQRLLGLGAVAAHAGDGRQRGGVGGVEAGEHLGQAVADVVEDGLVEVDAAQALQALGPPEQAEPGGPGTGPRRVGLADDGRVERAAAEVVDGDRGARLDALGRGVVQGGGLGLGEVGDRDALCGEGPGEQVALVRAPRRGVGDGDPGGGPALALGDAVDDPADQPGGELLGRPGAPGDDDRGGVADAALELADDAVGVGERPALGGVPDDHGAVGGQEQHGGDGRAAGPERDDLGLHPATVVGPAHRRGGVRRPQIDPELVSHGRPLVPPMARPTPRHRSGTPSC